MLNSIWRWTWISLMAFVVFIFASMAIPITFFLWTILSVAIFAICFFGPIFLLQYPIFRYFVNPQLAKSISPDADGCEANEVDA